MTPTDTTSESAPRAYAARLAFAFAAAFISIGVMLPYFPVWLKSLSLSDAEIGIILGLPAIVRITVTPLVASLADKARDRADVLIILAIGGLISFLPFFFVEGFWAVLTVVLIQASLMAPQVVLIDAVTITSVRRLAADYGSIRLWGSVAFVVANVGGGYLISWYGAVSVLPMLLFCYVLMIAGAFAMPRFGKPRRASAFAGLSLQQMAGSALWQRDFLLIILGASLIHASHGMFYGFSAIYWTAHDYSGTSIGILWGVAVTAEVVFLRFSRLASKRISVLGLMLAGGIIAAGRWLLFPFDPGFAGYFVMQLGHAASFGAVLIASQTVIARRIGEEQEASAQGLMFCFNNGTLGLATFASGYLYTWFGVMGFVAMSGVALMGCVLAAMALLPQPQRLRSGGETIDPE